MKTIVYISEPMNGGILTYLEELANSLCNKANIYILYGNRFDTPKCLNDLFNKKVRLINIPDFRRALNPIHDIKAYLEICKWIKRINPDIIHLNSSKAGVLGRLLLHHRGQKWFYTPHGYAFLMQNSTKIKRLIYYLVEWVFAKLGTETIACGSGEYRIARKLSKNSTYVNNGVNIDILKKYWSKRSNTKNVFFTVGRIDYQKNPVVFNKIAEHFPKYQFIWFGDGPLKNELTADNIKISSWLSSNQLFEAIQPYKYFILCSRWEGLPMALLEVMYFKKTCFVTNVVGNKDVINNGFNGYIFKDKIMLKIYKSLHSFDSLIGYNSYKTIIMKYNMKKFILKYSNNIYHLS